MMNVRERKHFMKHVVKETSDIADQCGLYYVICFWQSPITGDVEQRRGYFEDISEARNYESYMIDLYKNKFEFKYFIASNMAFGDTDGGLLDD